MKFVSWNVNGLRACVGKAAIEREESKAAFDSSEREQARPKVKGFSEVFRSLDADFFCLQETKMQAGQLDLQFEGYESYWNYADKKGYSGTAIFTRLHPLNVTYGMGIDVHDHEGRVVTLDRAYLQRLDTQKPVILCGDLNVAHEEIDIKNPKTNRHNAGFTDEERAQFSNLLNAGFTDTFRYLYPEEVKYSWWSYRFQARQKNAGWRIDYFVISDRLRPHLSDALIHTDIQGSDHCPVSLTLF